MRRIAASAAVDERGASYVADADANFDAEAVRCGRVACAAAAAGKAAAASVGRRRATLRSHLANPRRVEHHQQ